MMAGTIRVFVWIYFGRQAHIDETDEEEEAGADEEDEAERAHSVRLHLDRLIRVKSSNWMY